MKSYTSSEVIRIIKEIDEENTKSQDKISELRENQKAIKLLDFKSKIIIDKKIEELTTQT